MGLLFPPPPFIWACTTELISGLNLNAFLVPFCIEVLQLPCSWRLKKKPKKLKLFSTSKWTDPSPVLSVENVELLSCSRDKHSLGPDSTAPLASTHVQLSVLPRFHLSFVLLCESLKPRIKLSSVHCISEEYLWCFLAYECGEVWSKPSRIPTNTTFQKKTISYHVSVNLESDIQVKNERHLNVSFQDTYKDLDRFSINHIIICFLCPNI